MKTNNSSASTIIVGALLLSATLTSAQDSYSEQRLFGASWLPDKGVILGRAPELKRIRLYEQSDHVDLRRTLPCDDIRFSLKVQSDFNPTDEDALPAKFVWTKDRGGEDFWDADFAIRVDAWLPAVYNATGSEISLAFGYEIDRTDLGDDLVDLQTVHLGTAFAPIFLDHIFKTDQVMQIGAAYQMNGISDDAELLWNFDYQPAFLLPKGGVGMRCDFAGNRIDPANPGSGLFYSVNPVAGLSYGDHFSLGTPSATADNELLATYGVSLHLGAPLGTGRTAELIYSYKGAQSLTGDSSFDYQELLLKLQPNSVSALSIDIAYQRGMDGFDAPDRDRFIVGLGIQL
jgi:hypothetical protein